MNDIIVEGSGSYATSGMRSKLYLGDRNAGILSENGFGLKFGVYKVSSSGGLNSLNSLDAMSIKQITGNIGVGNVVPVTKLDVSGVITASGGNSTNWNAASGWIAGSGTLNTKIDNVSGALQTQLRTTSVFYPCPKGLTDYAASFTSGTYGRILFGVPSDFVSLNSLKLICIPIVTASGNRRVRIDFTYGEPGESYTEHDSSAYHTIDFGSHNIKQSIELSGYLPASFEALDTGFVYIGHQTDGVIPPPTGVTQYYGIELNYNRMA